MVVRQVQHRPAKEDSKGKELANLKRELRHARRTISRQEKRIRQLEAQVGEEHLEPMPVADEPPEPPPEPAGPQCPKCASANLVEIQMWKVMVVCKDCKHRWVNEV